MVNPHDEPYQRFHCKDSFPCAEKIKKEQTNFQRQKSKKSLEIKKQRNQFVVPWRYLCNCVLMTFLQGEKADFCASQYFFCTSRYFFVLLGTSVLQKHRSLAFFPSISNHGFHNTAEYKT